MTEKVDLASLTQLFTRLPEEELQRIVNVLTYLIQLKKELRGATKQEAEAKALEKLTDPQLYDTMGLILDEDEIREMTVLRLMADIYQEPIFEQAVEQRLKLRNNLGAWKAKLIADTIRESRKEASKGFGLFGFFRRRKKKEEEGIETVEIE